MKEKTKKTIVKVFWFCLLTPILALILCVAGVALFAEIPSFEELENPKTNLATQIISEDGKIINTFHIENRTFVEFDDLPESLVDAAIATEDVRFHRHSGIDFRSLARVAVKSVLLGNVGAGGGGSTITQQLAKTLFPREEATSSFPGARVIKLVTTKFKEWITAVKLERNYTKDEILTMYMNTIFFGSNAYGIMSASNTFFAKDPIDLNIEESALLVGMVNKPTRYNPTINPDHSLKRRNHVLSQMYKYGYLEKEAYDSIVQLPIVLSYETKDHNSGLAPYFRDMLRRYMNAKEPKKSSYKYSEEYQADSLRWENDQLYGWLNKNSKPDGSSYNLDKDGLKIYTTLNSKMQLYAEQAVAEHLGGNLQKSFFADMRWKRNKPFAADVPAETAENLMKQARRWSDRYRTMKDAGASESEINKAFNEKVEMRVFSWNKKGYIDTVMTPNDSIRYYKSFLRAAFVAVEPHTGNVLAYVGGPNYRYFKYDNARQSKRQVGSTIKPFLYTLAMQEGFTPCDQVVNVPYSFEVGDTTWTPKSTDKDIWIGKTVTLKWGLTHSSNNISAYLMKQFGPSAMVEMCHKLGIKSHLDEVPSLCVGPCDISPFEMVSAFNSFPSRGVQIDPIFVTRIEDNRGNVLSNFAASKREAISEESAYLMVNLMQGVVNEGTAGRLRSVYQLTGQLAGKTGTTNDQSDGWFIGYTPKITAGVWVGAEDRQVHFESLALGGGSNMALPIWGIFMKKVLEDGTLGISSNDLFVKPPGFELDLRCTGGDDDNSSVSVGNTDTQVVEDDFSFFE
ncbi:MAG: transglycosylase domain-containing protein [Bacteroidales bacterium]|nr:transglycosylase domain-containing protein [Bacteroidales bacterium]